MENWELVDLKKITFFIHQFSISLNIFLIHLLEIQAQIMGWHGWDSIYMITIVSSKVLGVRINLLHSVPKYVPKYLCSRWKCKHVTHSPQDKAL